MLEFTTDQGITSQQVHNVSGWTKILMDSQLGLHAIYLDLGIAVQLINLEMLAQDKNLPSLTIFTPTEGSG